MDIWLKTVQVDPIIKKNVCQEYKYGNIMIIWKCLPCRKQVWCFSSFPLFFFTKHSLEWLGICTLFKRKNFDKDENYESVIYFYNPDVEGNGRESHKCKWENVNTESGNSMQRTCFLLLRKMTRIWLPVQVAGSKNSHIYLIIWLSLKK